MGNESKGVEAKSQHPKDRKQTPKSRKGRGSQDEDNIREWDRDEGSCWGADEEDLR